MAESLHSLTSKRQRQRQAQRGLRKRAEEQDQGPEPTTWGVCHLRSLQATAFPNPAQTLAFLSLFTPPQSFLKPAGFALESIAQSLGCKQERAGQYLLKPALLWLMSYIIFKETMNFKPDLPLPALPTDPSSLARSHLPLSKLPPRLRYAPLAKLHIDALRRRANKIDLPDTAEQPQALVNRGKTQRLLPPTESPRAGRSPGGVVCSLKLDPTLCSHVERAFLYQRKQKIFLISYILVALKSHPKILHIYFLGNAALKEVFWGTKLTGWRNGNVTTGIKAPSHIHIVRKRSRKTPHLYLQKCKFLLLWSQITFWKQSSHQKDQNSSLQKI